MGPLHPSLSLPAALAVGIPPSHSHILSLLFTSTYVGSLYLAQIVLAGHAKPLQQVKTAPAPVGIPAASATGNDVDANSDVRVEYTASSSSSSSSSSSPEPERGSRDHPETIRLRLRAVQLATTLSLAGVYYVTKTSGEYTWTGAVRGKDM